VAHKLKSAARSVGALVLGQLCQQIETAGQAGDSAACQALIARIDHALTQAQERIVAYQDQVQDGVNTLLGDRVMRVRFGGEITRHDR